MSQAKLILLSDVPSLGKLGDIVSVRAGYARNWLLPRNLAIRHSAEAYAGFAERKEEILKQQAVRNASEQELRDRLDGYLLQVTVKSSPEGKLYGSLTQTQVAEHLRLQGYEVDRTQVRLPASESIKSIGDHDVTVVISEGIEAAVKLSVLSERDA